MTQAELKAAIEKIKAGLLAKISGDVDLTHEIAQLNALVEPSEPVGSPTKKP